MNRALVDRIADAVLYEGYILYPYRPSIKNRQRWTFGGLYPEAYCRTQTGGDASSNQTQCLVRGDAAAIIEAVVRFLHLTARQVGEIIPPLAQWPEKGQPTLRPVEMLRVGEQLFHTWQEAEEREVILDDMTLGELSAHLRRVPFTFAGGRRSEPVRDPAGQIVGVLLREQQTIEGSIEVEAVEVAEGLFRLTCRIVNHTSLTEATPASRDNALLRSLISAHALLGVRGGEFVSLLDPPECWREVAADCRNVGVWPVLVGAQGQTDTMLASPIILYDYPQVAPESPGDFFDGTEIDEMLTLRILSMTDEEKHAMAAVDERTRGLLARTETLAREQLLGLHGTIRDARPIAEEGTHG
jgi:hydrogenase maturation protease